MDRNPRGHLVVKRRAGRDINWTRARICHCERELLRKDTFAGLGATQNK